MVYELTQEFVERIRLAIDEKDEAFVIDSLHGLHEADITSILWPLSAEDSKYVLDLLEQEVAAEIIAHLDSDVRQRFVKNCYQPSQLAPLMKFIESDDAADILNEQPVKFREEVIANLENRAQANHIIELLRYDEECAGGYMAKELIRCNHNWLVDQCIAEIRRQALNVEKIFSLYVVDDNDKLLGRISLKQLLLSTPDTRVAEILDPEIHQVESYRHIDEVVDIMRRYDLEAIPVINIQGKLLGRITIDDVVDAITEQAEADQQIMAGLSEDIGGADNVWKGARARLPWLIIGMVGGLCGAEFASLFEREISLVPAMAFFIPLITATGGNVGIQSSTVMVQTLDDYRLSSPFVLVLKAMLIALINGIVIASLVFLFNYTLGDSLQLALVISISLLSVVILASFMGTITPLVMDKLGVNPALASGPFITTANDLIGLAVYFSVARLLISAI